MPTAHHPFECTDKFIVPTLDEVCGRRHWHFSEVDVGSLNANATDDSSDNGEVVLLRSPYVADELVTKLPLLRPRRAQALSRFLIDDVHCVLKQAEHVITTAIKEGFAANRM